MIKSMLLLIFFSFILPNNKSLEDYIITKTNQKFNSIEDYEVDMTIRVKIPAFRMPKKRYKVYYKNPNKVKVKARGFGILPKTGLFTSPNDNFDNLTNIKITNYKDINNINDVIIAGDLIVDSLKVDMPNEYTRLTFDPIVEVKIDTLNWVIKNVTTKLDTLKMFQIDNYYKIFDDKYYMPEKSTVKYFVKDKKLFNWINKDAGSIIGNAEAAMMNKNNSIVEGIITVEYKKYKINKGLEDKIFD